MRPTSPIFHYFIRFGLPVLLLLTGGCIPVEDFGKAWDQATIDPELEGHWKAMGEKYSVNDHFQSFIRNGDAYDYEGASAQMPASMPKGAALPSARARTMIVGKHKFILINTRKQMEAIAKATSEMNARIEKDLAEQSSGTQKQPPSQPAPPQITIDGGIQRYSIENGILTIYILDEHRIEEAITQGKVRGTIPKEKAYFDLPSLKTLDAKTIDFLIRLADEPQAWKPTQYSRVKDLEEALKQSRTYPTGAQTEANTTVHVELPGFKFFCDGKADLLRRHLQASPEWHVFQEGQDDIIAYRRRELKNGAWQDSPSNGYFSNWGLDNFSLEPIAQSEKYQIRYLFRFNKTAQNHSSIPEQIPGFALDFKQARPMDGNVRLNLKKDDQGIESYLAIGGAGMWFEFFEQTWKEDRTKTREAITWLSGFSKELMTASHEIEEHGYAAKLIPAGSITHGRSSMQLTNPDSDHGYIAIEARVNPARQGFVFLKAFDATNNKPLDERATNWGSKEYIGWSKNPNTLFSYRSALLLPSELTKKGTQIRVELWFRPSDGAPSRRWFAKSDPADIKLLEATTGY